MEGLQRILLKVVLEDRESPRVALTPQIVDGHNRRLRIQGEQFGDLGLVGIEQRRSLLSFVARRLLEREEPVDGGAVMPSRSAISALAISLDETAAEPLRTPAL